jgi:hypothetical protein
MRKYFLSIITICLFLAGFLCYFNLAEAVSLESPGLLAGKSGEEATAWVVGRFIKGAVSVVGAVALFMFVYGGFVWVASAGSSENLQKGKNIMIWATIGLIIILFSYATTDLIITALTGPQPPPPPPTDNPPPEESDPPETRGCAGSYIKTDEACCSPFDKYPSSGTTCKQGAVNHIFRCCDCGHTTDSQGFVCRPGERKRCTDTGVADISLCTLGGRTGDGNQYDIIIGHCGTDAWWCSRVPSP